MPKRRGHGSPAVPLCLLALALPASAHAQRFGLDLVPQGSFAYGLSEAGHLVGTRFTDSGDRAFVFHKGVFTDLHPSAGHERSAAHAVNRFGAIAGEATNFMRATHAVFWDTSRTHWELPRDAYTATGISDFNTVVGNAGFWGFSWNPATGASDLQGLEGWASEVSAINAGGTAVGTSRTPGGDRATLWTPDRSAVDILPGETSRAAAISAQGWVVGQSAMGSFLWSPEHGVRRLDNVAGPASINSAGQVVGLDNNLSPVLWNPQKGQTHSLVDFAQPGWQIGSATAINRHAQVAVTHSNDTGGTAGILTLHPDWEGGSGRWLAGDHWNWAGTGVANADIGRMHDVNIAASEPTTVTLDGAAQVGTLRVAGAGTTLALAAGALQAESDISFEAGSRLAGTGALSAASLTFGPGSRLHLAAADILTLSGAIAMDLVVLAMHLGARLVLDGDAVLRMPRFELELGAVVPESGMRFDLLDWTGSVDLGFDSGWSALLPPLPAGLVWQTESLWVDGSIAVQAIPEPATWALLAMGMVLVMQRRLNSNRALAA
jgi:hypothetical protein